MLFATAEDIPPNERGHARRVGPTVDPSGIQELRLMRGRYRPNMPADHHGIALFMTDRYPEAAQESLSKA